MFRAWGVKDWLIAFLTYGLWAMFLAMRNSGFSAAKAASAGLSGAVVVCVAFVALNGILMKNDGIAVKEVPSKKSPVKVNTELVKKTSIKEMPAQVARTEVIEKKAVPTPVKVKKAQVTKSVKTAEVKRVLEKPKVIVKKPVTEKPKVKQAVVTKRVTEPKKVVERKMDEGKYQRFKAYAETQKNDIEKLKKLQKKYPVMFQRLLKEKQ